MPGHLLRPRGRQDLGWSLGFLAAHAVPGLETWDGRTYRRVLTVGSVPVPVALRVEDDVLVLQGPAEAVPVVRDLLGMDDDTAAAEHALASDAVLGPLVRRRPGLRVPGSPDHLETLVRTVVGQQVSLAAAATVTGRIVGRHGRLLEGAQPDGPTHAFPDAEALAAVDPASLPMTRARGRTVVGVAAALARDPGVVHDPVRLLALPGIGPWTAGYLRLRVTRDPDVLLAGDLAVRRQLARLTTASVGRAGPASPGGVSVREAAEVAARWAPHRTTAMLQLWADYLAATPAGAAAGGTASTSTAAGSRQSRARWVAAHSHQGPLPASHGRDDDGVGPARENGA